MNRHRAWAVLALLVASSAARAALPPTRVNYQGVLRGSADAPLTGSYDMRFGFWDAATGGVEIMLDEHAAATGDAVTVSGGLFDVLLGGGNLTDGSGPGTYTSLDAVFRDHSDVWLEVRIEGETLAPRTHIQSAPYALNATSANDSARLAGQPGSYYLDTSSAAQTKLGRVLFDNAAGTGAAVEAVGADGGGTFRDGDGSAYSFVGRDGYGIEGYGTSRGAYFKDLDGSGFGSWASAITGSRASATPQEGTSRT